MRTFIAAISIVTLLTSPAFAQRGGKRGSQSHATTEQKKPKMDEKAYKGALDSIPERKADPWAKMR